MFPPFEDLSDRLKAAQNLLQHTHAELWEALRVLDKKIHTTHRLSVRVDRRFLTLDFLNVVQAVESIGVVLEEETTSDVLESAIADTLALIADMTARANAAIAQHIQSIAIHTSVAAHRVSKSDAMDVTDQIRAVAAAPLSPSSESDAPGVLVSVAPLADAETGKQYGRVSGEHFMLRINYTSLRAAPQNALVLPAGSVAHFQEGENFLLYHQGCVEGDPHNAPVMGQDEAHCMIVEAGPKGATLHGPATIDLSHLPRHALKDIQALHKVTKHAEKNDGFSLAFMFGSGAAVIASTLIGTQTSSALIGLGISALSIGASGGVFAGFALNKARRLSSLARGLPERLQRTNFVQLINDIGQRHKSRSFPSERTLKLGAVTPENLRKWYKVHNGHGINSLGDRLYLHKNGCNLFPPNFIHARHEDDVRVMMPLLALPAPSEPALTGPDHTDDNSFSDTSPSPIKAA